jgi:hypothetical protein
MLRRGKLLAIVLGKHLMRGLAVPVWDGGLGCHQRGVSWQRVLQGAKQAVRVNSAHLLHGSQVLELGSPPNLPEVVVTLLFQGIPGPGLCSDLSLQIRWHWAQALCLLALDVQLLHAAVRAPMLL